MRRLLAVGAVTVAFLVAFALAQKGRSVMAAGTGNLTVTAPAPIPGCPLGPAFTFCSQNVGTSGPAQFFTVKATNAVIGLSFALAAVPGLSANFATNDFRISGGTCGSTLAANTSCEVGILFSPTATGLREAALNVSDAAADKAFVNVDGTGSALTITPPAPPACPQSNAFTYCSEGVGVVSATQTFTLTAGSAITGLGVTLAAIPGLSPQFNTGDFTIESTTCLGSLAAGQSCTVSISFTPTTAGLRSAALTTTDSSGDSAVSYLAGNTTSGLSITPASVQPASACSPGPAFQFCNEPRGGETASATYTLSNTSGTQLAGISVPATSAAGNFTVTGTTCVTTLPAAGTCTINVAFTPQATGLIQDTLTVTDSSGDLGVANFAGVGDDYSLQLVSGQASEVTVVQSGTATFMAEVVPDNVFGQNGEKVTFVCPVNLPLFTTCAFTPCPVSITPGTPAKFSIIFVTSSETVAAPPVTNPCEAAMTANVPPGLRGPELIFRTAPGAVVRGSYFASPAFFILALLGALTLATGATVLLTCRDRAVPGHTLNYLGMILATAGFAAIVLAGCGGGGKGTSSATPTGETNMTVTGNALDSSGNPLNASRTLPTFTLDVVANTTGSGPLP